MAKGAPRSSIAMTPYRSPAPMPRPIVHFGNKRRALWLLAAGWACIVVPIVLIGLWLHYGGRITLNSIGIEFLGALLIARAKWGELELDRARGMLVVVRRGILGGKRIEVPIAELEGLNVGPTSTKKDAEVALQLVTKRGVRIDLQRGGTAEDLEPERAKIGDFLIEHRALGEPR